jgi:hypothetical protein
MLFGTEPECILRSDTPEFTFERLEGGLRRELGIWDSAEGSEDITQCSN